MVKITMKIDGMMCGMCESHINDAIRRVLCSEKGFFFAEQRRDGNYCK